ncbi:MAG: endonuclease MutS2 [Anaerolineae bacterium]|jgi:DNA mismatch repair protein MutS2
MNLKHHQTLELPKILERLARHADFSAGAAKARHLEPSTLFPEIEERLTVTTEAVALLNARPQTSVGGARDVRPQVEAAQRGATLVPRDLLDIRSTLISARSLQKVMDRLDRQFPRLADIAGRIAPCSDLIDAIGRCLDERGEVRDEASNKLARVRRDLEVAHGRLMDKLQRIITDSKNSQYLQEALVTRREGRYVIPLKADFKGRIPGVVHDRSASGATIFIEPLSTVDLNNAWRELQIEEEQEVQRILAELSARVANQGAQIDHTVEALADLDLAFAKAKYAQELEASAPELIPRPASTLRYLQARHPLLDPETVVPIDVELADDVQVLVITGPNTGGKTVTLKTVGLLTLMAQAGLHIPVAPGSALTPFEAVYADIGDEQSIEQSLSTYSSHLTNILSFIDQADQETLVLLDELGAGTDPAEGSALARALLDAFRNQGATTLVATHYPELKAYAQVTPGVRNASVEFDTETLQPTYHLTIGLPGRSNAFAIASRLGMGDEILRAAESMVEREDRQTEDMLEDLHQLRLQAVRSRDAALAVQAKAREQAEELERRLAQIEEERAEVLRAAREEAQADLEALREEMGDLRRRMEASAASTEQLTKVEREVEALEESVPEAPEIPKSPRPAPAPPARPIEAGDVVYVPSLGAEGQVLSVDEDEAEVQVGPARTWVPLNRLELRGAPEPEPERALTTYETPDVESRIDLRGAVVEEALTQLDRYLDAASLSSLPQTRIVHGKGTGALRRAVRQFLSDHPLVESYRAGEQREGGQGVTIVKLIQG